MKRYQNNVIYLGEAKINGKIQLWGQYEKDEKFHTLVCGKTGVGKTNYLETTILQKIHHGRSSVVVFDPHGDLIQRIAEKFPDHRKKDLIIIDPTDKGFSYGINPLKKVHDEHKPLVVSGVIEIIARHFGSTWSYRQEHLLRYCLYTLLETPSSNLGDIARLLVDADFRGSCRRYIRNEDIERWWVKEFPTFRSESLLPLITKLSSFTTHPSIIKTLIRPSNPISLRKAIDNNKVVLVRISIGQLGRDVSTLIGSMLLTSLSLAAYSRANVLEWQRPATSIVIDEFANFTTSSLVSLFSEVRKYNVGITIATQALDTIREDIRSSILANVGSIVSFRVSHDLARVMAKYLYPLKVEDLIQLPNYYFATVLMINGVPSVPFIAKAVTFMEVYNQKLSTRRKDA